MLIYVYTFLISCLLILLAENIKNRKICIFILSVAILLPSILAGARADTIGTDVRNYSEPAFKIALMSQSLPNYVSYMSGYDSNLGLAYLVVIYLSSRLSHDIFFSQFIVQFIIITSVLMGLWKFKKKHNISVSFAMFLFYFIFYNVSLNMMRQSISMFILFWAFSYLMDKKYMKYIFLCLIAVLFHTTAILGIFIITLYYFMFMPNIKTNLVGKNSQVKHPIIKLIIISFIIMFFVISPRLIGSILSLLKLPSYTTRYLINANFKISPGNLILRLPFLLILIFSWNSLIRKNNGYRYFYLAILIADLLLTQLSYTSTFSARIADYTTMLYLYEVPDEILYIDNKIEKAIFYLLLIICVIIYWYYFMVVLDYNETVPYIFK